MLVKITKEQPAVIEETIELITPAYFKNSWSCVKVEEDYLIRIWNYEQITIIKRDHVFFDDTIKQAMACSPATDADFTNAYNNLMQTINPFVNNAKAAALCVTPHN